MAFTKGDEVYVSSSTRQHRGVVSKVDGSTVNVLIAGQTLPFPEDDCTAVPDEDRTLSAPLPSGLTPVGSGTQKISSMMSQATRDSHVAVRDAKRTAEEAETTEPDPP